MKSEEKTEWCKQEKYANFNLCMALSPPKIPSRHFSFCFKMSALLVFGPKLAEKDPKQTLSLCSFYLLAKTPREKRAFSVEKGMQEIRHQDNFLSV
jgi:hypothetical protein